MSSEGTRPQILEQGHYSVGRYDERKRWAAYWYQIDAIRRCSPSNILEIGPGSGTVTLYAKHQLGIPTVTFDCDPASGADLIGDVRNIHSHVPDQTFDLVTAFQVLEHVPFEDLSPTLSQISAISRRHFIVSLPHCGMSIQLRTDLGKKLPEAFISRKVSLRRTWKYDGMHFWEIGARQYPLGRVLEIFSRSFRVVRHYFCPDWAYHYFIECETAWSDTAPRRAQEGNR